MNLTFICFLFALLFSISGVGCRKQDAVRDEKDSRLKHGDASGEMQERIKKATEDTRRAINEVTPIPDPAPPYKSSKE
jgi:hypothetical protein